MDAARLAFGDAVFDAVYAPYVVNVAADPVAVAHEILRVCRPSGRLILLNHFADADESWLGDLLGRMATCSGVNWHIDLSGFLRETGLSLARSNG